MLEQTFIYLVARRIRLSRNIDGPARLCALPFHVLTSVIYLSLGFYPHLGKHHAQPSVRLAAEVQGEGVAVQPGEAISGH